MTLEKVFLNMIFLTGVWLYLYISVLGILCYLLPYYMGEEPVHYTTNLIKFPILFGLATYAICGAGHRLDIIAEREKQEKEKRDV